MALLLPTHIKDIQIAVEDWPRCYLCQMPVEDFRVTDLGNCLCLMASCHGKYEIVDIPDELWDNVLGNHVNFGFAFKENTDDPSQ